MPDIYVPVLKAKEGEFAALEFLRPLVKDKVVPLFEIPSIPFDHASGMPSKTLEQHISGLPDRIFKAWHARPFYLDTPYFREQDRLPEATCALGSLLNTCQAKALNPIPVVRTSSSALCFETVRARADQTACLRLDLADFGEDIDTDELIQATLELIDHKERNAVDLMIDLGELPKDSSTALLVARSVVSMIPTKDQWRRVIFSSSAFPEDLSGISSRSIERIPRKEWSLWQALLKKPALLPANLVFSDNTISHPTVKGIDPRVMRMSAAIRYTASEDWVVVKGSSVGRFGFEQYFDLCKRLVELPEYFGEAFSWGDHFITNCALSMAGPGNATTWRKVGVNHHIALVVHQLSNSVES